jgi:hypothetical protein
MKKGEGRSDSHAVANTYACMCCIYSIMKVNVRRKYACWHAPPPPPPTISSHIPPPIHIPPQVTTSNSTVLVSLSFSVFKLGITYFPRSECYSSTDKIRSIVRALHALLGQKHGYCTVTRIYYWQKNVLAVKPKTAKNTLCVIGAKGIYQKTPSYFLLSSHWVQGPPHR